MLEEDFWNYAQIAFLQGRIDRCLRGNQDGWSIVNELAAEPMNGVDVQLTSAGIFIRVYGVCAELRLEWSINAALQAWYLEADVALKNAALELRR